MWLQWQNLMGNLNIEDQGCGCNDPNWWKTKETKTKGVIIMTQINRETKKKDTNMVDRNK